MSSGAPIENVVNRHMPEESSAAVRSWKAMSIAALPLAVFGLLPSELAAPGLAAAAAREILKSTDLVAAERQRVGQPALGVGVGIATGAVVLGILGSKERRTLSVTGHSVNLAARLESRAAPGEILMDERTFDALEWDRAGFAPRVLDLKGMDSPITAFGWMNQDER